MGRHPGNGPGDAHIPADCPIRAAIPLCLCNGSGPCTGPRPRPGHQQACNPGGNRHPQMPPDQAQHQVAGNGRTPGGDPVAVLDPTLAAHVNVGKRLGKGVQFIKMNGGTAIVEQPGLCHQPASGVKAHDGPETPGGGANGAQRRRRCMGAPVIAGHQDQRLARNRPIKRRIGQNPHPAGRGHHIAGHRVDAPLISRFGDKTVCGAQRLQRVGKTVVREAVEQQDRVSPLSGVFICPLRHDF